MRGCLNMSENTAGRVTRSGTWCRWPHFQRQRCGAARRAHDFGVYSGRVGEAGFDAGRGAGGTYGEIERTSPFI